MHRAQCYRRGCMCRVMYCLILLLIYMCGVGAEYRYIEGLPQKMYTLDGDLNIGGLFPLHQPGADGSFCGTLRELGVLQRAEAMAYYIREMNDNDELLPNITLGFTILDDCYKETTALAQGLQFIPKARSTNKSVKVERTKDDFVAVIGAESSTNSKQLAELLGLFKIPQISYLSTSPSLENKIAYPFFTRIVPSDKHQVVAMIHLLNHFNWTYVSFVYSISFYGLEAYLYLLDRLKVDGNRICLAVEVGLPEQSSREDYEDAVRSLIKGSSDVSSHVVILFLSQTVAMQILHAADRLNCKGKFTFIASDAWGRNVQDFRGVEALTEGALTIKISSRNEPEFDKHFASLTSTNLDNPFLAEFWNFSCNASKIVNCTKRTKFADLHDVYKPESTVSLVKMAVYLLAHGLQALLSECRYDKKYHTNCTGEEFRNFIDSEKLQHILGSLKGCVGGTCVDMNGMGEGQSLYLIMNLQKIRTPSGTYKYDLKEIGHFDTKEDVINITEPNENIYWNSDIKNERKKDSVPESICSKECRMGQRQKQMGFDNTKCCWICEDCAPNEFTNVTEVEGLTTFQCQACEARITTHLVIFMSPTDAADQCQPIVPQSIDLSDPFAIVILVVNIVCILATIILLVLYVRNKEHRLIKATSLELSYIIWSGIFFSFISVLFYILPLQNGCHSTTACVPVPNTHLCYLQFTTFSLAFTIINAPMLTRVNRIYRIFTEGKKTLVKPRFIETKYQLIVAGILILAQIIIIIICCLVSHFAMDKDSIMVINVQDEQDPTSSYISCEISPKLLLPPVIYNLLLGIASAYHAFKTRKLPDNFNESRFIGMTVYTTVIMWIAFIPAYISINSRYYKGVPLSVALLINAVITMGCLFVPRLYALRWIEGGRMNLRSISMSISSISRRTSAENKNGRHGSNSSSNRNSTPDVVSTTYRQNSERNTADDSLAVRRYTTTSEVDSTVLRDLSSSSSS